MNDADSAGRPVCPFLKKLPSGRVRLGQDRYGASVDGPNQQKQIVGESPGPHTISRKRRCIVDQSYQLNT